jgi:hypothetical protein
VGTRLLLGAVVNVDTCLAIVIHLPAELADAREAAISVDTVGVLVALVVTVAFVDVDLAIVASPSIDAFASVAWLVWVAVAVQLLIPPGLNRLVPEPLLDLCQ